MADAKRDSNRIPTLTATSTDGVTPVNIMADPVTHQIFLSEDVGVYAASSVAHRDANRKPTILAISRTDGITPVEVYADPVSQELIIEFV